MLEIFYSFAIFIYKQLFRLTAVFSAKARKRISGLRAQKVEAFVHAPILIHCASAGEFEQALPVVQALTKSFDQVEFVFSFFSPSGKEWIEKKAYNFRHYYLPFDTKSEMEDFISRIKPRFVIVTKNEFWFIFFGILEQRNIPHFLIAAAFKKDHYALRYPYTRKRLQAFESIFLLDQLSLEFSRKHLPNARLSGDPRIDQILAQSEKLTTPKQLKLNSEKPIIIYASVHEEDISIIKSVFDNDHYHHIIVPHEVDDKSISYFQNQFPTSTLLSKVKSWNGQQLIVNEIGILSSIYPIATFSYIGGGFGKGIHNLLEAAVCSNIVFVGPNNQKFPEARTLIEKNAIFAIQNDADFVKKLQLLGPEHIKTKKALMLQYFQLNQGVSAIIASEIIKKINGINE